MAYQEVIRHHPVPGGLLLARWHSPGRDALADSDRHKSFLQQGDLVGNAS